MTCAMWWITGHAHYQVMPPFLRLRDDQRSTPEARLDEPDLCFPARQVESHRWQNHPHGARIAHGNGSSPVASRSRTWRSSDSPSSCAVGGAHGGGAGGGIQ